MSCFRADRRVYQGFGRGLEAGVDERSGGSQGERGGQAPTVGDPIDGEYGGRQIHDDRHERPGGTAVPSTVPAAFGTLGHDDVGTQVHRPPGFLQIGRLDDQRRTCPVSAFGEGRRI